MSERLQKVMAHAGVASRRKCEEIIAQGRVKVNGRQVTELGVKVDLENDVITVDGEEITPEKKVYIMVHKPVGYVTTVDDPRGRPTVLDLIPAIPQRVYPVGRLDWDSSGLLLVTNDGQLTHILTHPRFEMEKEYLVDVEGKLTKDVVDRLEQGVRLSEGRTAPCRVEVGPRTNAGYRLRFCIHEGRNRQIRRMCKAVGLRVVTLKRVTFGPLTLDDLHPGESRYLDGPEIRGLMRLKGEAG